jgi:hypothetical protein
MRKTVRNGKVTIFVTIVHLRVYKTRFVAVPFHFPSLIDEFSSDSPYVKLGYTHRCGRLRVVQWRLILVGLKYVTCLTSGILR